MANLVETTVDRILSSNTFKDVEFGNSNIQEEFNVSKSTAAKALKALKDMSAIVEGSKKGKYVLAQSEANTNDETPETEETTTETPKTEETTTETSNEEPCVTQTFEVYLNGSYLTTITAPLNELISEVRASNPNATLESVEGNEAYFVKQKGTKA